MHHEVHVTEINTGKERFFPLESVSAMVLSTRFIRIKESDLRVAVLQPVTKRLRRYKMLQYWNTGMFGNILESLSRSVTEMLQNPSLNVASVVKVTKLEYYKVKGPALEIYVCSKRIFKTRTSCIFYN